MDEDQLARLNMVQEQIIRRGVTDSKVINAMKKVPRHKFVPGEFLTAGYADYPSPIGEGQTISQPYMVALMSQCLALKGGEKVLEIGLGSGYQAAVLAEIAREVYSLERFPGLVQKAKEIFDELGYVNVNIKVGDGTLGWSEVSPFDGIIVTAGAPDIPPPLIRQLSEGGRLVIPLGGRFMQTLAVFRKKGKRLERKDICGCVFVPLIGKEGWKD